MLAPLSIAGAASHGFTLRAVTPADEAWLCELYASTRSAEMAAVPWPEAAKRSFLDQQFALQRAHFEQHYSEASFLAILAPETHSPIGRYYVLEAASPEHLVVDIALFPHWQNQGIGSTLIRQSQARAADSGAALGLHVLKHNPSALRLYRRLGFEVVSDEGMHWRMRWQAGLR
ncbi:MAG: GNAT family N-acetyltransferase [Aquimonas sp.]